MTQFAPTTAVRFPQRGSLVARTLGRELRASHSVVRPEDETLSSAADPATAVALRPLWDAFKIVLMVVGVNLAGAGVLSIATPNPSPLKFFVFLCMMTFTSLPMTLALIAEAISRVQETIR
jgi:hypothetical protein